MRGKRPEDAAMPTTVKMPREEKKLVVSMFKSADRNRSGQVDLEELQQLLECVDSLPRHRR